MAFSNDNSGYFHLSLLEMQKTRHGGAHLESMVAVPGLNAEV